MDFLENVKLARDGDANAFANLYSHVYKDLYYTVLCNLNNEHDAADAVSEAVLDAYKSIGKLKNIEAFKGWMFKILMTKIKRKQAGYINSRNNRVEELESILENSFEDLEMIDIMRLLGEDERICISLKILCGYKSKEISNITGMKASTVRSHISRGKKKLKNVYTNS